MNQGITDKLTKKKKKHALRIILSISLFIHLIFLFIFLSIDFQHPLKNAVKVFQETIQQFPRTELPASLKPKKSNFGTPVLFEDSHELEQQEATPKQSEQAPVPEPAVAAPQELPKNIEKLDEKDHGTNRNEQIALMIEPETKTTMEYLRKTENKKELEQQKTVQKEHSKSSQKKPTLKSAQTKIQVLVQPQPASTAIALEPLVTTRDKLLEEAPVKPAQKKRNIIAMTNGFIQNLKNKGDDLFERKGNDNKRPDFDEYKHISYQARLLRQFQAARIERFTNRSGTDKREKYNLNRHNLYKKNPIIEFVIDHYGNIVSLQITQSSGSQDIDNEILEDTKKAAPFPPIPKHFKTEYYPIGIELML